MVATAQARLYTGNALEQQRTQPRAALREHMAAVLDGFAEGERRARHLLRMPNGAAQLRELIAEYESADGDGEYDAVRERYEGAVLRGLKAVMAEGDEE